jgi:hypothetical protein
MIATVASTLPLINSAQTDDRAGPVEIEISNILTTTAL